MSDGRSNQPRDARLGQFVQLRGRSGILRSLHVDLGTGPIKEAIYDLNPFTPVIGV